MYVFSLLYTSSPAIHLHTIPFNAPSTPLHSLLLATHTSTPFHSAGERSVRAPPHRLTTLYVSLLSSEMHNHVSLPAGYRSQLPHHFIPLHFYDELGCIAASARKYNGPHHMHLRCKPPHHFHGVKRTVSMTPSYLHLSETVEPNHVSPILASLLLFHTVSLRCTPTSTPFHSAGIQGTTSFYENEMVMHRREPGVSEAVGVVKRE